MFISSSIVVRSYYSHKYLIFPCILYATSLVLREDPRFPGLPPHPFGRKSASLQLSSSAAIYLCAHVTFLPCMTQVFHFAAPFCTYTSTFTDSVVMKPTPLVGFGFLLNFTQWIQWHYSYGAIPFHLSQRHKKRKWVTVPSPAPTPFSPSLERCRECEGDSRLPTPGRHTASPRRVLYSEGTATIINQSINQRPPSELSLAREPSSRAPARTQRGWEGTGARSLPASQTPEMQRAGAPSPRCSSAESLRAHSWPQPSLQGWAAHSPFGKVYASFITGTCQEGARRWDSSFLAWLYLQYLMFCNWSHASELQPQGPADSLGCRGSKTRNAEATIQWICLARQKERMSAPETNLWGTTQVYSEH